MPSTSVISRRRLILAGARLGASAATLSFLPGCGGGDGSSNPPTAAGTATMPVPAPSPTPTPTPTPSPIAASLARLKLALATGHPRQVSVSDPLKLSLSPTSTIPAGVAVGPEDARVRVLGGRRVPDGNFPSLLTQGQSTTYSATTRSSLIFIADFTAPAQAIEIVVEDVGGSGYMDVEIDGISTSHDGYFISVTSGADTGKMNYIRLDLPPSAAGKRIRCTVNERGWGGLIIPPSASLADATPAAPSSMVFLGDSITQGSVATRAWHAWAVECAHRLGIDNPIISGVAGNGYLAGPVVDLGYGPELTFRQRINDVLQAVEGGPPDAVVIAGGINDNVFAPAAVGAEALAYFQALRTAAPDMAIFVVGPFAGYTLYEGYSLGPIRDAIFASAAHVARVSIIDVTDLVTPANRDTIFRAQGADGPHPTNAGHAIYAQFIFDRISAVIGAY